MDIKASIYIFGQIRCTEPIETFSILARFKICNCNQKDRSEMEIVSELSSHSTEHFLAPVDSGSHRETHDFTPASSIHGLTSIREEIAISGHLFEFEVSTDADFINNHCEESANSALHRNIYGTLDGVDVSNQFQGRSRISRVATMMGILHIVDHV